MDFFKSILSDHPVSPKPDNDHPNPTPSTDDASGGWSFGGLIKDFAARSESVLETYRRDLKEFGSGLRNETDNLREIASRAVKELPASLEAGASAAHGSLESVSHALDEAIKSTGKIVSKESLVFASNGESETLETKQSLDSGVRYHWFTSQLSLIQNDANTFCQEPAGADEYKGWRLGFDLGDKKGEIDKLIGRDGALEGVYKRVVVPGVVDPQTFWYRYFYRVHKLEQQDRRRANLMRRENAYDEEEELPWDVEGDDDGDSGIQQKTRVLDVDGSGSVGDSGIQQKTRVVDVDGSGSVGDSGIQQKTRVVEVGGSGSVGDSGIQQKTMAVEVDGSGSVASDDRTLNHLANQEGSSSKSSADVDKYYIMESSSESTEKLSSVENMRSEDVEVKIDQRMTLEDSGLKKYDDIVLSLDEKMVLEEKGGSLKKNDASAKVNEEELEWDEIEDVGSGDEKKISVGGSDTMDRAELRKLISAAVDDDLSWDIEDDDEPAKA